MLKMPITVSRLSISSILKRGEVNHTFNDRINQEFIEPKTPSQEFLDIMKYVHKQREISDKINQ